MKPLAFFHHACVDGSDDASNFSKMDSIHTLPSPGWQRLVRRFSLSTLSLMVPVAVATAPALACNCGTGAIVPVSLSGFPQLGSSGPEVIVIQQQLNRSGFPVGVDGVFGSETDRAVRGFQSANGLAVDGVVGPATRQALVSGGGGVYRPVSVTRPQGVFLQRGDQGTEVRLLQSRLNQLGYYFGPLNGFFDGPTEVAVRQFQRDNGLVADGIVGPDTTAELRRAVVAFPGNPSYPTNPPITPVPPVGGPNWSSNRYVVVIPSSNGTELNRVRQFAPGAFFVRNDPRGPFINAGVSPQINWANQQSQWLRKSGFDARVVYFR